jgi:hypothetical protein
VVATELSAGAKPCLGNRFIPVTASQCGGNRLLRCGDFDVSVEVIESNYLIHGGCGVLQADGPPIALDVEDDGGTDDGACKLATRLAASDALAVVGPVLSTASLAAGPILAQAGLVSIVSAVESDFVTRNAMTFHANFKNSEVGDWLADYAHYALGRTHAAVVTVLLSERSRLAGRSTLTIENVGRAIFVIGFLGTITAAFVTFG